MTPLHARHSIMTGTALVRPRRAVTAQVRSLVPDLSGPPWAKRSVGQQKQPFRANVCKLPFSSLRDLAQISLYRVLLGSSSQTSHVPFFLWVRTCLLYFGREGGLQRSVDSSWRRCTVSAFFFQREVPLTTPVATSPACDVRPGEIKEDIGKLARFQCS